MGVRWLKSSSLICLSMMKERAAFSTQSRNNINANIVHLNHAGASPFSDAVLERVCKHMQLEKQLGGYAAATEVQNELASVYQSVADLLHATSAHEIALVESATVAWTRIFYAVAAQIDEQRKGTAAAAASSDDDNSTARRKVVLISEAEYASNVVAACRLAQTNKDWTVYMMPSSRHMDGRSTGKIDLSKFAAILQGRNDHIDASEVAVVCVTHIPTNSGIVNPVDEIGKLISEYNKSHRDYMSGGAPIFYLVDACQAVGQLDVNVQTMNCDALVGTGRKYIRGPRGTGFLYVSDSVLRKKDHLLWPDHIDHVGCPVKHVPHMQPAHKQPVPVQDILDFEPLPGANRFEFYESNIAAKLGLGIAVQELLDVGLATIAEITLCTASELFRRLEELNEDHGGKIQLHHHPECGIVTFWVKGISSQDLQQKLWNPTEGTGCSGTKSQFEVSVVPATSTPLDSSITGVPDLVRASVSYSTTLEDIDQFCEELARLLAKI